MSQTDVLILGAGPRRALDGLPPGSPGRLASRVWSWRSAGTVGGTRRARCARTGFTFDHTGHLLHLHDPYGKKLILDL